MAAKTRASTNIRNIYRVRAGWYLQLQWSGCLHRELFSDIRYGGQEGALKAAIESREFLEMFRGLLEHTAGKLTAAYEAGDAKAYRAAVLKLYKKTSRALESTRDRELHEHYFAAANNRMEPVW